jgi:hypothetical protein
MHYLSLFYSVNISLHVSGLLVAHHQVVTMYICDNWYVLYVLADSQLRRTSTSLHIYILLPPNDGGPGSSVGIATGYGLGGPGIEIKKSRLGCDFRTLPGRPWGPPSLLYNGYRVFPGGKAAGAWC